MFDQQSVGSSPGHDTCVLKQDIYTRLLRWEVVLSAVPAMFLFDDTQACIRMDCGNPVSAPTMATGRGEK